MFLKRMELQGFKSFADKTIIEFDDNVIGIVGPNGCGKSNINDAIRWVLGEQSVKSLRGSNMSDVIFAGSTGRKPVNMAQVTLVFDNTERHLAMDFNEIEVTRRIYRMNGENEYFINKTPCRLKDIVSLVMDSGLGRDSLSVISQGSISSFAESKPEERRAIFEEAAGVAKYKKRKMESLAKLERTQDNLVRLEDIAQELEKQVKPLEAAAKKALTYLAKKTELEKIEISVIVDDVEALLKTLEADKEVMFSLESEEALGKASLQINEQKISELRAIISASDVDISKLQEELMSLLAEIQTLDARKIELDEKRKYQLETADNEGKAIALQAMCEEASFEYDDRKARCEQYQVDEQLIQQKLQALRAERSNYQNELDQKAGALQSLKNHHTLLENLIKQPFQAQAGVKAIVEAKLDGVYGTISDLVVPHLSYEQAISSSLGGAMFHLVCENEETARKSIHYLKKNRSGRATFLPLAVLKPNVISEDPLVVARSVDGFLGVAKEFVHVDAKFDPLLDHLLANVLIVSDLKSGNELARRLKYNYKIITLDGDAINKGGSMSGGYQKQNASPLTMKSELAHTFEKMVKTSGLVSELQTFLSDLDQKIKNLDQDLVQVKINIAQITPILDAKRAKFERLQGELEALQPYLTQQIDVGISDELVMKLSQSYQRKDTLQNAIKAMRETRFNDAQELERKEVQLSALRKQLSNLLDQARQVELRMTKNQSRMDFLVERLSNVYEMTFEHAQSLKLDLDFAQAKLDVNALRQQIQSLGNVNLDAPEQYEELKTRFDTLKSQVEELQAARDTILRAIAEMDDTMSTQFLEMFHKINNELDGVFKALFGGGKAKLVLVDPDDVLHTGIDIDVQPPGKAIQNIRLFSGGEKSLIAISVLFSILKARTVPLCIFDEVEAALDQANVERFAKYLANFSDASQFIVVTHRPGTMAQCQALYGVTMHQNGVSQLLKVKLSDAVTLIKEEE